MFNARRIECFTTSKDERWALAGNVSGQITVIDIETFQITRDYQAHAGMIHAIACHPTLPYVASIGTDHTIALWLFDITAGHLDLLSVTSVRDIVCTNDSTRIDAVASSSVALTFHDTKTRLATRSGNGGVLEADFEKDGQIRVVSCARMHEDWDVQMVRYLSASDCLMSAGRDGRLVMSREGNALQQWKLFGKEVCHWVEHIGGHNYLVASDAGKVGRLDVSGEHPPIVGERFARDDMEFVTYNAKSKRAFATSFDRGVYEIDPVSCQSLGLRYSPGYKCVWAKSLMSDPSTIIVHSRNGGLYKANVETGQTIGVIHECPPALWSFARTGDGVFWGAGEGSDLTLVYSENVDNSSRITNFKLSLQSTKMPDDSYTKRVVFDETTKKVYFGRTSGEIWMGTVTDTKIKALSCVFSCRSAIRDLAVDDKLDSIFLVTEDGFARRISRRDYSLLAEFQTAGEPFPNPLWALSYNPDHQILAVADRGTQIYFLTGDSLEVIGTCPSRRVKRMKWLTPDRLLYGDGDKLMLLNLENFSSRVLVGEGLENSIEDFIWDASGRYLLAISYQCVIGLYDLQTGYLLDVVHDRMDYSKGLTWTNVKDDSAYPWDFATWGRSGAMQRYRLHEDQIMSIGPI